MEQATAEEEIIIEQKWQSSKTRIRDGGRHAGKGVVQVHFSSDTERPEEISLFACQSVTVTVA
jgi:hypothetical protein